MRVVTHKRSENSRMLGNILSLQSFFVKMNAFSFYYSNFTFILFIIRLDNINEVLYDFTFRQFVSFCSVITVARMFLPTNYIKRCIFTIA